MYSNRSCRVNRWCLELILCSKTPLRKGLKNDRVFKKRNRFFVFSKRAPEVKIREWEKKKHFYPQLFLDRLCCVGCCPEPTLLLFGYNAILSAKKLQEVHTIPFGAFFGGSIGLENLPSWWSSWKAQAECLVECCHCHRRLGQFPFECVCVCVCVCMYVWLSVCLLPVPNTKNPLLKGKNLKH